MKKNIYEFNNIYKSLVIVPPKSAFWKLTQRVSHASPVLGAWGANRHAQLEFASVCRKTASCEISEWESTLGFYQDEHWHLTQPPPWAHPPASPPLKPSTSVCCVSGVYRRLWSREQRSSGVPIITFLHCPLHLKLFFIFYFLGNCKNMPRHCREEVRLQYVVNKQS